MAGKKADAERFASKWRDKGDENQDTQLFWIDFYQNVLGVEDAIGMLKFETPVATAASSHNGYIDVLVPSAKVIIEQKSRGIDLAKPETRQGRPVTPAQQALAYAQGIALSQQPRYVVACNFAEFWVYDRERDSLCREPMFKLALEDLPKNLAAVQFLKGKGEAPETISQAVSIEAGKIMAKLHSMVAEAFDDPDAPENHHALSVLMTRLMFLMFCEDAGLTAPNAFRDYVAHFQAADLRQGLKDLFKWLDTPDAERDRYAGDWLKKMPYMNGGLFRECTEIPPLSEEFRTALVVEGCQEFDWTGVSPTVFGSIFEGALSHDHRRANGQHFTSPANIHKLIDPLFLDGLNAEFEAARAKPIAGGGRTSALKRLHKKIGNISILDPAAGSGNFLTESYLCLRRLENRILFELQGEQTSLSFEDSGDCDVLVSLGSFHGIEIEDFACCVARTALWIAEKQADMDTAKVTQRVYRELPLKDYGGIVNANSLRLDWNDVVPANEVDFVIGNPPFIGYSNLTASQKEDRQAIFGKSGGVLDYVACWYKKAADYTRGTHARCAFVSTNSVCQGQQVEPLWKSLFDDGIHIDFAHQSFVWNSDAPDEAHVHVVIVGFSREETKPLLFDAEQGRDVPCINAYLSAAPVAFVSKHTKPLCDVPEMAQGFKAADNGYLLLSGDEYDDLIAKEPYAESLVRPFSMGADFIKGERRYCLWLPDMTASDLKACPTIRKRIEACREWRSAQTPTGDAYKLRNTPHLLRPCRKFRDQTYIGVPTVSSGRRKYVPMGFVDNGMIPGNQLYFVLNGTLYSFGIMMSQFHNAWMRVVAGRLKSDYRYTNTIVYNNFVWPNPDEHQRAEIERCAQAVLDARSAHPDATLADMYDPDNDFLFPDLTKAHAELDAAVEAAYGVDFGGDEEKIVAHLFKLYAEKTAGE